MKMIFTLVLSIVLWLPAYSIADGDDRLRLAILYFDNSGEDAKLQMLRKGMADMLITDLSKVKSLDIVERGRLEEIMKEQDLSNSKSFDNTTAANLGKLLGAETILTGSFFNMMGTLRVDARFIDVETGKILKSDGVQGSVSEFFSLEKELVEKIVANLEIKLTDDERAFMKLNKEDEGISYEDALAFSQGLDLMDLGKKEKAKSKMTGVLANSPKFEPALNAMKKLNEAPVMVATSDVKPVKVDVMRGGGDPLKGLNISKALADNAIGKYYALIIGIDEYSGEWTKLNNAVNDASTVEQTLKSNYRFDVFQTLYDSQATRTAIMKKLEWLVNTVKENDNVFIYYSGHGEFKKSLNKGYWVPYDSKSKSVSEYISNSDIQTFLGGIKSKHTLLVADACFSGDIFRGTTVSVPFSDSQKYYEKVYNLSSRHAITSGGIEPVMDGGKDNHSVFAYYFLKALKNNQNKYLDASQLYESLKIPVINNSEQSPNFSPIKNTGDEGGQFLFIRKT
ncbi:MAG: caspase family protein [Flavobacteriales bacterium]|nr:caspase family protein [Flavobacteriales bacterium]